MTRKHSMSISALREETFLGLVFYASIKNQPSDVKFLFHHFSCLMKLGIYDAETASRSFFESMIMDAFI